MFIAVLSEYLGILSGYLLANYRVSKCLTAIRSLMITKVHMNPLQLVGRFKLFRYKNGETRTEQMLLRCKVTREQKIKTIPLQKGAEPDVPRKSVLRDLDNLSPLLERVIPPHLPFSQGCHFAFENFCKFPSFAAFFHL